MPSLPTSLIIVGLVAAWLVVLVPMVARRREQVPENTDESANFRVLHRDSARRRPILSRTAMAHRPRSGVSDDDGDLIDEVAAADSDRGDRAADDVRRRRHTEAPGTTPARGLDAEAERADCEVDDGAGEAMADSSYDTPQRARYEAPRGDADDELRSGRDDRRDTGRRSVRISGGGPEPAAGDDREYRRTPIRQGRGGFDPAAADRARAYRFRQRQRVALTLAVLAVAGAAVGVFGSAYGYGAAAVSGSALVLYLAYLRRQVRIENEIRQRRVARLARARQIRPGYRPSVAEQVYSHRTGEVPRPGEVDGYRVSSHVRQAVPPAGFGYGEPIDFEDSDPAFDDLEYYRPTVSRRRAG